MIGIWRRNQEKRDDGGDAYFKKRGRQKIFAWIIFAVFMIYAVTLIFPFAWILMNSLKSEPTFAENFHGFPAELFFSNYKSALLSTEGGVSLLSMFGNSLLITTVSTLITLLTSGCAAYIVAKFKFRGRNLIYSLVIFSLVVPIVGTLPSLLQVMRAIKLYDTVFAVFFIYSGGFGMNFLILYGFFKSLSMGYAEAAYIDGAGDFRVFFTIMLPLAMPSLTAVGVLTFIGLWNEYVIPQVLLPGMPTISVGLFTLSENLKNTNNWTQMFAAVVMALVPILIVFLIFQNTIMTNTVAGGLKG
ncbi:MAG: carbohydrate ABC transporter permease [Clostridiales bacterium]|jgi:raffinose/stachyose/melibiose transport system permease protein/N-acetylglucosamine transport system permease protein|nr:carbohydrate ABC transporter permease [Clostridiales bacterium]